MSALTYGWICLWFNLKLEELDATCHAALENTLRVILPIYLLQPLLSLPLAKDILPRMRIIEVDIARLLAVLFGSNIDVMDKSLPNSLDCGRIVQLLPRPTELGYNDWAILVSGKRWYCLLQERRTRYHRRRYQLVGYGPHDPGESLDGIV